VLLYRPVSADLQVWGFPSLNHLAVRALLGFKARDIWNMFCHRQWIWQENWCFSSTQNGPNKKNIGLLQYYCTDSDLDELLAMWSASGYSVTPLSPFFSFCPLHLPSFSPPFIF
jgi:hypothetical protein